MSLLKNLWIFVSSKDLQSIQEKYSKYDRVYVLFSCICENEKISHNKEREKIEELYKKTKKYLDKDFEKKIETNFVERLWEIFLIDFILEKWYKIEEKKSDKWPDLQIKLPDWRNLWIEFVVANEWNWEDCINDNLVWNNIRIWEYDKKDRILRIRNSIHYKYNKYFNPEFKDNKWRNLYVKCDDLKDNDIYLVAIYPKFPIYELEELITGALYSRWDEVIILWENWNNKYGYLKLEKITKKSWKDVECGIFLNDSHKMLSWIISFEKDIFSSLLDTIEEKSNNTVIYWNDCANNKIDFNF